MKKKFALSLAALPLLLTGCGTSYTFEAHPSGDGDSESWQGDPTSVECFTIEADSSNGDDGDQQLGEFCKTAEPSDDALADIEDESEDDD